MNRIFAALTIVLLVSMGVANAQDEKWSSEQLQFFEAKIRPVLTDKCYQCHSEDAKEIGGSLRVDTRASLIQGGDSGSAIEPGSPSDSLLITAIRYEDEDFAMPPKKAGGKLDDNVIADFEKWIRMGAADPRTGEAYIPDSGADETAKQWWAFQPIKKAPPPTTLDAAWPKSDIDRFVLAKLESAGIKPVADADPMALLRRVYFDLVGLPPSAEEAKRFAAEWKSASSESARDELFAMVVDQLLDSPQFGERWGRHWLDVARYSESSGKDVNVLFPLAWRYRDYVIDSFNDDVPYEQFIREQIAGDLMNSKSDEQKSRQLIATGFLAIGPKSLNEMKTSQFVVDLADEQLDTVTQSVMGLTVACARCHDHKFDPISQKDYTAFAGIFLSTDTFYGTSGGIGGRNAGKLVELPDESSTNFLKSISKSEYDAKKKRLESLQKELRDRAAERQKDRAAGVDNGFNILRIVTQISAIETEMKNYNPDGTTKPLAMGVSDKPKTAVRTQQQRIGRRNRGSGFDILTDSPLFVRGDIDRPGDKVARAIPEILDGLDSLSISKSSSGRKELAIWLTDKNNPMTPRVVVNRVWHWLFGAGIVTSVDNFGTTGSLPSHPELLDYLSLKFMNDGWSFKKLIREVVLSRTYRLAATHDEQNFTADPANELLWRHSPRRLDAEAIRDAMLVASGLMDLSRPEGSIIGRAGDGPLGGPRAMALSEDGVAKANSNSRSVYLSVARNVEPEVLAVFDFPDAAAVQGARQITNVPGQALFMLNSDFAAKHAKGLAKRVLGDTTTARITGSSSTSTSITSAKLDRDEIPAQLDEMYWIVFGRPATASELSAAKKLLANYRKDPLTGWTSVARALLASAEFRSVD